MPVFGKRQSNEVKPNNTAILEYAGAFKELAHNILTEDKIDIFSEPTKVLMRESTIEALRDFFCSDFINEAEQAQMSAEELEDRQKMQLELFENNREAVLEHTGMVSMNPLIGLSFPIHKNILINNVFDNGAVPKAVAASPRFTIDMEVRILIGPNGEEIDMFKEQDKIHPMIRGTVPFQDVELTLPETGTTDILDQIGAGAKDNLSITTKVSAIQVQITKEGDATEDKWYEVDFGFTPTYMNSDRRQIMETIKIDKTVDPEIKAGTQIIDTLSGFMEKNRVVINSLGGNIKAIKLTARRDLSNGMVDTCTVRWKTDTKYVEIPEAIPINITVTPDEIKDISKLYNVNQLSKMMEMIKDVMANDKDDYMKEFLDDSFRRLPADQKFTGNINFAVTDGYLTASPKTWRHEIFMDSLDEYVTNMLQVLNDGNMIVTIVGRTDLIRKILPVEYTFQTTGNTGAIPLEFQKTVYSTDNRTYEFYSSDKIRLGKYNTTEANLNDLIVMLKPKGTDRIMYILYDYQLYIANDIRNYSNPTLPSVHAFDRYRMYEYQPVQARITIENPNGHTTE